MVTSPLASKVSQFAIPVYLIGPLMDVAVNFMPPDSKAFFIASRLLAMGVRLPPS